MAFVTSVGSGALCLVKRDRWERAGREMRNAVVCEVGITDIVVVDWLGVCGRWSGGQRGRFAAE